MDNTESEVTIEPAADNAESEVTIEPVVDNASSEATTEPVEEKTYPRLISDDVLSQLVNPVYAES